MQLPKACNGRQPAGQYLPYFDNQRFTACQLPFHEVDIEVEVLVVELIDHFPPDQSAELFQIHHKARQRIWLALDCHNEVEIVPMPVFICTRSEYFNILLGRPGGIVQLMRGIEMLLAADVDHAFNFDVNIEPSTTLTKPSKTVPMPPRLHRY